MDEYISKETALKMTAGYASPTIQAIHKRIESIEPADAVPVVRCKECMHAKPYNRRWVAPILPDKLWCEYLYATKDPDFYCAAGERK